MFPVAEAMDQNRAQSIFFLKMAELQCNSNSQTYRVSTIKIETLSGKNELA